jgi:mono/diheme cytochrome c family protein
MSPSDLLKSSADGGLEYGPENYPDGRMFNTITHGIRSMAGYERQISVEDRWAIVMYVRALQLSQHATLADVPAEQREALLR